MTVVLTVVSVPPLRPPAHDHGHAPAQPANLHLNSVTAILLIDSDGHRLLSKYYQPAHVDPKATGPVPFKNPFQTDKEKRQFEQQVWDKTRRSQGKHSASDGMIQGLESCGLVTRGRS